MFEYLIREGREAERRFPILLRGKSKLVQFSNSSSDNVVFGLFLSKDCTVLTNITVPIIATRKIFLNPGASILSDLLDLLVELSIDEYRALKSNGENKGNCF